MGGWSGRRKERVECIKEGRMNFKEWADGRERKELV